MDRAAQGSRSSRAMHPRRTPGLGWPELSGNEWFLIAAAIAAAFALGSILVSDGFRRAAELTQAQHWEAHTLNVIASAERSQSEIRNMERGERGYLLTADDHYLLPYTTSRARALMGLAQLQDLTRDNLVQVATFRALSNHFHQVDKRLAATIADEKEGRSAEALAQVEAGHDEIGLFDTDIETMIRLETRLLKKRRRVLLDADLAAGQNRLALSGLGLFALAGVVWLLFATLSARRAAEFERDRAQLAEQLVSRETQLAEQIEELDALYSSAPIGLAFFSRDYRYLRVNEELAMMQGMSVDQQLGRTVREVAPFSAAMLELKIDHVFATGEPVRNFEVTGQTLLEPGVTRYWLTGYYPVRDEKGKVDAVGAWLIDISERKRAEEREALLAREVDHRSKNLLAIVQSVVQLTKASEPEDLRNGIVGRIQALARAHSLLADARWDGAQLGELVRDELAPYLGGAAARVSVGGPNLLLRPAAAQSLGMVLHELATNAAKYGALSVPDGRLEVRWQRTGDQVEIRWTEKDGPPVKSPRKSGFGSKIVRASVERQLHGSLMQDWRPAGLQCTIAISAREALGAGEPQSMV